MKNESVAAKGGQQSCFKGASKVALKVALTIPLKQLYENARKSMTKKLKAPYSPGNRNKTCTTSHKRQIICQYEKRAILLATERQTITHLK
ncbi:MAG: hypothetical protein LBL81_06330 [Tannerella sp.]|jgi:hypothetical protein|nr:hypothetical protein [Tannerella sp.]